MTKRKGASKAERAKDLSNIKSLALSEDGSAVRITFSSGHVDMVSSEIGSLVMLLSQAEQTSQTEN